MLILHIHYHNGHFYLWGEHAFQPSRTPSSISPFDPGIESLKDAEKQSLADAVVPDSRVVQLELTLPTVETASGHRFPLPSQTFLLPEDLRERLPSVPAPLAPWSVHALQLHWKSLFALLGRIEERKWAEGLFVAEEVIVFSELFRYAGALVARGRYLPDIHLQEGSDPSLCEAVWSPCLDSEEDLRLRAIAAALPPAAYPCTPSRTAMEVVEAVLADWLDHLVRASVITTLSLAHAARGRCYSAHDAWFTALRGESRVIRWPEQEELLKLAGQIRAWRHPVEGSRTCSERPAFILHAPQPLEDFWILEIARVHPEESHDSKLKAQKHLAHASYSEATLLALGQAALLFPPLGQAEIKGNIHGAKLSMIEAYFFLTSAQALLRSAGYDVKLPPEWEGGSEAGFALAVDVAPHTGESYLPDARVAFHHTVTFKGAMVSQEELKQLLDTDSPLVCFRGTWLVVDTKQLQQALRINKQDTPEEAPAIQAVQLALGSQARRHGLPVAEVRGHGWLETLFTRLSGDEQHFGVLETPRGFCGEMRPYQLRGFSWLAYLRSCGFGGCLADDMGLGKTIQALAFLLYEKERGEKRPVLIAGPLSVLGNWLREAQRFAPGLRCHLHHGGERWHGEAFAQEMEQFDVVITSYHLLYRDYADLRQVAWAGILLDEAQNIKNPETRQSKAARALKADYRLALTGTPLENHVGDLWSIMDFLNPDMLGKRSAFRDTFFRPIQTNSDPGARIRLKRMTAPFILRRLKTDKHIISDLPEKIEAKVYCPMTPEQLRLYQDELNAFHRELGEAEGIGRRGLILATLTRLKQICNHPEHYFAGQRRAEERERGPLGFEQTHSRKVSRTKSRIVTEEQMSPAFLNGSGKLMRLTEQLEELFANDECALIFTQYAEMGHLLVKHLCETFGRDMPFLHGGVTRGAREQLVKDFQESTTPQAFVLSLKAGGLGLNLTRATHVFHYDRWWNPAVENQATDRAFRIGQTKRVLVHKFICNGTLEDRIDALLESKSALAAELIGHGENVLTELSDESIRSLLALEDPVGSVQ
jgi:superfamily II DNA or RNA helicase